MTDYERNPMQAELGDALVQRDAIRRELGDLRAWLCLSVSRRPR
ncbi:hypothetical protein ACFZCG_19180 [Streptomyces tanashiensis]